jgi:Na+-driven multidrug efflux pump
MEDPWGIAYTLQNFVSVALGEHDYESAKAYAEETIALFERAGDRRGPLCL